MFTSWARRLRDGADRHTLGWLIPGLVLIILYFWHLSSLPLSNSELAFVHSAGSARQIVDNFAYAPQRLLILSLSHLGHAGPLALRSISAVSGLIIIYCLYKVLGLWFGRFSARLGVMLFASTPLLILAGRSASSAIGILWPLSAIAAYMYLIRAKNRQLPRLILLCVAVIVSLYQPGGLLFILAGAVYARSTLGLYLRRLPLVNASIAALVLILGVAPMIIALIHQPDIVKTMFFVPEHWPTFGSGLRQTGWAVLAIFWHSSNHHELQIGRLAILDATQIILVVFGAFAMWTRARAKVYELVAVLVIGVIASAINQSYSWLLVDLAALSVVITAGLRYLHLEWTGVFPRNPLPRGLAICLLVAVVALNVYWGLHYSLSAWPHSLNVR